MWRYKAALGYYNLKEDKEWVDLLSDIDQQGEKNNFIGKGFAISRGSRS